MCLIDFYYSYSHKGYILNLIRDRRTNTKLKYGNEIKDAIINIVCLLTNIDPESISVLNE